MMAYTHEGYVIAVERGESPHGLVGECWFQVSPLRQDGTVLYPRLFAVRVRASRDVAAKLGQDPVEAAVALGQELVHGCISRGMHERGQEWSVLFRLADGQIQRWCQITRIAA